MRRFACVFFPLHFDHFIIGLFSFARDGRREVLSFNVRRRLLLVHRAGGMITVVVAFVTDRVLLVVDIRKPL